MLISFQTIIQDTGANHIFNDLIYSLGLPISLRMICRASDEMSVMAVI
jgi:hypothetical protein